MKVLSDLNCQFVSGGGCEGTIFANVNLTTPSYPIYGLYFLGTQVQDLKGNVIFSGTSGVFTHDGITYTVTPGTYGNIITTEYHYSISCNV